MLKNSLQKTDLIASNVPLYNLDNYKTDKKDIMINFPLLGLIQINFMLIMV